MANAGRDRGMDHRFRAAPSSVGEARRLVTAWLSSSPIADARMIDDVALAVSEACTNVVVHAYAAVGGNGNGESFRLEASRDGAGVCITVTDFGGGLAPRPDSPGLGLGLPLIASLADRLDIDVPAAGRGTVVAMWFAAAA